MEDFFFKNDAIQGFGLNSDNFTSISALDRFNNGNVVFEQIGLESLSTKESLLQALTKLDDDMDISFKRNIILKSIIANKQFNLEVDTLPSINIEKISSVENIDGLSSIHVKIRNTENSTQNLVGMRGWPPRKIAINIDAENKRLQANIEISENELDDLVLKLCGKPGWKRE